MTNNLDIIVCSLSIGDGYKNATKYATLSKVKYCEKMNYTFIDGTVENYDTSRNITWSKINLIKRCIYDHPSCDYVVWIDADIILMNYDIKLSDLIAEYMNNKTFMMSRDNGYFINTGVIFVKNNLYALNLLNRIYYHENVEQFFNDKYAEQGSFEFLYKKNVEDLQNNSTILLTDQQSVFNCSMCYYKYGLFNLHYLGASQNLEALNKLFSELYQFPLDGENDELFQKRMAYVRDYYSITYFERNFVIPEREAKEKKEKEERERKEKEERVSEDEVKKIEKLLPAEICVCSFNIGEKYKTATFYGHESKKIYCRNNGYSFVDTDKILDNSKPELHIAFQKIPLLKQCLEKKDITGNKLYKYVVWMDADSTIMRDDIRLESFIDKYLSHYDDKYFLLSRDNGYNINTGIWFMKNNNYVYDILTKVWENSYNYDTIYYEQSVFCGLYDNNIDDLRQHVVALSTDQQHEFNCSNCFYKFGDFIIHFLVLRDLVHLQQRMEEMYIYQKDNETVEEYNKRQEHIKNYYSISLFERFPPT